MPMLNRVLLSIGLIFSVLAMAIFAYAADGDEADEPTSEPAPAPVVEVEEIKVYAHDLCNPHELQKILNNGFEENYGGLSVPGDNICGKAECLQEYFTAGRRGGHITDINDADKKFTLATNYSSNYENKIVKMQKRYPEFEFKPVSGSAISGYFFLALDIKFEDMYNAGEKDIQIYCPTDTCTMVQFGISDSNIYFVENKLGDGSLKREFIIHPGLGSKVLSKLPAGTSAQNYQSRLEKCEYEPKSSPQDQGLGGKHRHH